MRRGGWRFWRVVPPEAIGDGPSRVLVAVVVACRYGKLPTIDLLVDETGFGRSTVHGYLKTLRAAGLVDWQDGKKATLRPSITLAPLPKGTRSR